MQRQQFLGGEAYMAHLAFKLSLCPVLVKHVSLVTGALPLVLQVTVARGVGAVAVTAAETVWVVLVTVTLHMALKEDAGAGQNKQGLSSLFTSTKMDCDYL